MYGFETVEAGRFERESPPPSETREGGSRRIAFRTTWRIQRGDVARSSIGNIEVAEAFACEPIYSGGWS